MDKRESIIETYAAEARRRKDRRQLIGLHIIVIVLFAIIYFTTDTILGQVEGGKQITEPTEQTTEATPTETPVRFRLSAEERKLIEGVVMAEAGGEDIKGQMLVAQCILNACEQSGHRPQIVVKEYQYSTPNNCSTESVKTAVTAVFDNGEQVTAEKILFFYAPKRVKSKWHETQVFCLEWGGHRFFKEA